MLYTIQVSVNNIYGISGDKNTFDTACRFAEILHFLQQEGATEIEWDNDSKFILYVVGPKIFNTDFGDYLFPPVELDEDYVCPKI